MGSIRIDRKVDKSSDRNQKYGNSYMYMSLRLVLGQKKLGSSKIPGILTANCKNSEASPVGTFKK